MLLFSGDNFNSVWVTFLVVKGRCKPSLSFSFLGGVCSCTFCSLETVQPPERVYYPPDVCIVDLCYVKVAGKGCRAVCQDVCVSVGETPAWGTSPWHKIRPRREE